MTNSSFGGLVSERGDGAGAQPRCPTCGKPSWSPQVHPVKKKGPSGGKVYWFWKYRHARRYTRKDPKTGITKIYRRTRCCFVWMGLEEVEQLRSTPQPDHIKNALAFEAVAPKS